MARNSFSSLDKLENLSMKINKSGERRRTDHSTGKVGAELAKANSPSEIAAIAAQHGIRADEIESRAKGAPNFGQFRMVLGNRIRNTMARMAADKSLSAEQAAYPKEHKASLRAAKKATNTGSKKTIKKLAKVVKIATAKGPAVKKVKKTRTPQFKVRQEDGTITDQDGKPIAGAEAGFNVGPNAND